MLVFHGNFLSTQTSEAMVTADELDPRKPEIEFVS